MRSKPTVKVTVLGGATDNLTGSCYLITINQGNRTTNIAVDIGLVQTAPVDFFEKNLEILNHIKPNSIHCVILTHAHTDHISRLPMLTKYGFSGRVFCTYPTTSLSDIMLNDSAKIQMDFLKIVRKKIREKYPKKKSRERSEKAWLGKHDKFRRKASLLKSHHHTEPLYDLHDVEKTYELIKYGGCEYHSWIRLDHNIHLKLYHSGHVLGGATCLIKLETTGEADFILGFSGDLGRNDGYILPPPEMIEESVNWWFTESTYGGRPHPKREDEIEKLVAITKEAIKNKGIIIIPSFALERTQEMVYLLSYFMQIGLIDQIPIYLDSPMAIKITKVFAAYWDKGMFADQHKLDFNPFDVKQNRWLKIIVDSKDSKALISSLGPYIVIAGSGTCDAGRVRDHLRAGIGDDNTYVYLVGYMPADSLGRKLKENSEFVKMNDEKILIKSKNVVFDSFSAHADGPSLASYSQSILNNFKTSKGRKQKIFIVHGDPANAAFLRDDIMKLMEHPRGLGERIIIPKLYDEFSLKIGNEEED